MFRRNQFRVFVVAIAVLSAAAVPRSTPAQQFRTSIEARTRVFQAVGPGVTALKHDSSGQYYVLAKPATAIQIYASSGNLIGQIPNANSKNATIKYAVDIDVSPEGLIYVADRGANAVEIFKADGTLVGIVPVNAPTSLATLSDGQFAVTSLTSDHLVQIRDGHGSLVRSFGDPSDIVDDAAKTSMMEWGRISGDSADNYFAITSVTDPTLRKYDRFGYAGYETTVPASVINAASTTKENRAELSVSMSHLSLSDETVGSITLGSSRDLKFSAGMGSGLLGGMRYGGGYGRGSMQGSAFQSGTGNSFGLFGGGPFGAAGGGPLGGTISGEISDDGPQFNFGLGRLSGIRRGAQGRTGGASASQTNSQGAVLQFNGSGDSGQIDFANQDLIGNLSFNGQQSGLSSDSEDSPFGNATYQAGYEYSSGSAGQNLIQSGGLPNDFVFGSLMNSYGFRPQMSPGSFGNGMHSGGENTAVAATRNISAPSPSTIASGVPSSGGGGIRSNTVAGARPAEESFRPRGHYGRGEEGVSATVRVNLGDLSNKLTDKSVITAVGIDPATHEIWAGIGDTLVHFSKSGDPLEIYNLTMKGGTPLKPTAILVEPDRFLIAADPWGVFEFARPDRAVSAAPNE
jgi:hypothetical protein